MSRRSIKLTALAAEDLIGIQQAIAKLNPFSADRILLKIEARIATLCEFPDRGFRRPRLDPDMRIVIEGNYLVMYKADELAVTIVRVVYGRRDLSNISLVGESEEGN